MSEISFLFFRISHRCSWQILKQSCYRFPSQNQCLANAMGRIRALQNAITFSILPGQLIQQRQYKRCLCYINDVTNTHEKNNIVMTTTFL